MTDVASDLNSTLAGRYAIRRELGAGGMATVFLADDLRHNRQVAIKVLRPELATLIGTERFLREIEIAAGLNHSHVLALYDSGAHNGIFYFVMPLAEGGSLRQRLEREKQLPLQDALRIAREVSDALDYAHRRGVIHRDIKPENLMFQGGHAMVADFGIARAVAAAGVQKLTATGVTIGTPAYMSPEQCAGRGELDGRSDQYGLACVLYEMLAGHPPFTSPTAEGLVYQHLSVTPRAVSELRPIVPAAVGVAIARALAKTAADRFSTTAEFAEALEALEGGGTSRVIEEEIPAEWSIPLPPAFANVESSGVELVGRDPDLAVLAAAAERARAGRRQFVFVAGEAGIGKTRLISEFARSVASSDAVVLLGRCDAEALTPYQPFVQALEWYIRGCPMGVLQGQLDRVEATSELAELIPSISRRVVTPTVSPEANAEGRRYRLFEAIASFLAAVSQAKPVIIILEDVHWADRPTLLLLRHILRSSHEGRVLLVATYRETELERTHPLGELLSELRREPSTTLLKLRTLNDTEIAKFVDGWLGRAAIPSLVKLVAGNTEGNPLFMSEVLRHLEETGKLDDVQSAGFQPRQMGLPEGVREVIGRRVARLTEDCRRVLAVAAVVGRDFTFPILEAVSDLPEDRLLDVLDEAQGARLIEDAPGITDGYTFTHALIGETLYGELTTARRVRYHRRVAEALEQGMKAGQEPLGDLAYHYGQAASRGDVEKAVSFAVRAGDAAAARFAGDEAGRFYGMALHALSYLPDSAEVRARLLELHVKSGSAFVSIAQWPQARVQFEAALNLVSPEEREQRAGLLVRCADAVFWGMDISAARQFAEEAIEIATAIGRDDLCADAMACLAAVDSADGNVLAAVERDRRAVELAGGVRNIMMVRGAISLYHAGLTDESILRSAQTVVSARSQEDPAFLVYGLSHYGMACSGAGRYAEAQGAFDEAREVGRRHGILHLLARSISISAGMHTVLGNFAAAENLANEARDLARQVAFPPALISSGIDLLFIFIRSGELGRAEGILDQVSREVPSARGWHGWLWTIRLQQVLAEMAFARGDWRSAEDNASTGVAQSRARHRVKYEALGLITRARARKQMGDIAPAVHDAASAVEIARRLSDPGVLIAALAAHLDVEGNDVLLAEARSSIDRVLQALPDEQLRKKFLASENVRQISA